MQNEHPVPTKPYLLRAIYEWCMDQGYTPYLVVKAVRGARLPMEFVRDGEIVLNISPTATNQLKMDNQWIRFSGRFGGVARQVDVPVEAVAGLFARENGEGLSFVVEVALSSSENATDADDASEPPVEPPEPPAGGGGKRRFQVVK